MLRHKNVVHIHAFQRWGLFLAENKNGMCSLCLPYSVNFYLRFLFLFIYCVSVCDKMWRLKVHVEMYVEVHVEVHLETYVEVCAEFYVEVCVELHVETHVKAGR